MDGVFSGTCKSLVISNHLTELGMAVQDKYNRPLHMACSFSLVVLLALWNHHPRILGAMSPSRYLTAHADNSRWSLYSQARRHYSVTQLCRIPKYPLTICGMDNPQWPVRKLALSPPSLDDLASAISTGLESNFSAVNVSVSTPPDLRQRPFYLAGPGLSGNVRIADVGGQANIRPEPNRNAQYDLLAVSKLMEMSPDSGMLLGAGAGPFQTLGYNSELMPNLAYGSASEGTLQNSTHYAKITQDGQACCEKIGESTGFGLMCNIFGCDGKTGPLLHVAARGRTGKANFTDSIRAAVGAVYGAKLVSLGGVFVIHKGKTKLHVMPDFPQKPFKDEKDVGAWLKYFDVDPSLVCLTVFHSGDDQGTDLRMEHTHCFAGEGPGKDRCGGHYHFDLDETMEDVEYEGWFNAAEVLYRIDQPEPRS
ncbi:hypothetical protein B0J13DRAFT_566839 [Dactylonectria estremocensis]|uniref:DUF1907 domain-containing protein n=1 Tax=Dactylonectria estremocensis TaxID=1079267 RepID=A0A9P9DMF5_9HYPO|nr:hypothetical protein B0J13DRAFT_566839 [Dactylonectria estremocensis]